jgi:tRNA pseudouridine55 synthase
MGHCGTLDRFASGLLVICTGYATKLTRYFLDSDKRYIGTIKLGIITDTFDSDGKVKEIKQINNLSAESVYKINEVFTGELEQLPPLYSALKIGGKRASDLARRGEKLSLQKRKIIIRKLNILKIDLDNKSIEIDVTCSKGTYIRSLAADIGEYLGTGAHLAILQRVASGIFNLENAATIDELKKYACGSVINKKFLLKPTEALKDFSSLKVKDNIRTRILNGAFFAREDIISIDNSGKTPFIILDEEENLIAIADVDITNWLVKYLNVFN